MGKVIHIFLRSDTSTSFAYLMENSRFVSIFYFSSLERLQHSQDFGGFFKGITRDKNDPSDHKEGAEIE